MTTRYQTRPVQVEAVQWDGTRDNAPFRSDGVSYWEAGLGGEPRPYLHVPVYGELDKPRYAFPGDWLVRHGFQRVRIYKAAEFVAKYERAASLSETPSPASLSETETPEDESLRCSICGGLVQFDGTPPSIDYSPRARAPRRLGDFVIWARSLERLAQEIDTHEGRTAAPTFESDNLRDIAARLRERASSSPSPASCSTCGLKRDEAFSEYCSNPFHLTPGERAMLANAPSPAGVCSRCRTRIKDFLPPQPGGMTAGYYVADGWKDFANPGEVYICDACMWSDPRYIAVYGHQPSSPSPASPQDPRYEREMRHVRNAKTLIAATLAKHADRSRDPLYVALYDALQALPNVSEGSVPMASPSPASSPSQESELQRAKALHAAVAAIYFADSSDYRGALWDVVRALSPETADLLESNEQKAYVDALFSLQSLEASRSSIPSPSSPSPAEDDSGWMVGRESCTGRAIACSCGYNGPCYESQADGECCPRCGRGAVSPISAPDDRRPISVERAGEIAIEGLERAERIRREGRSAAPDEETS